MSGRSVTGHDSRRPRRLLDVTQPLNRRVVSKELTKGGIRIMSNDYVYLPSIAVGINRGVWDASMP